MGLNMRYIAILMAFTLSLNINAAQSVYNIFADTNNIYSSSLNNTTNSFSLNNSGSLSYSRKDISSLFSKDIMNKVNYFGVTYSRDIKYMQGANAGVGVLFPNIKSFVKIENKGYSFFDNFLVNSFTIEFYLNPYKIRMNSKVLSKTSIYQDGDTSKYAGIRANIIDGRLVWQFNNLFMYNGKYTNVTLSEGEYLKENEWRHHSISFDSKTGKLVKYIDGLEDQVIYLTSTGDRMGSPYVLDISNISIAPIYLGQGFIGGMDGFYFSPDYKRDFNLEKYLPSGEVLSKVMQFNSDNIFIDEINYIAKTTNATGVYVYYRTSNEYFSEEDSNIEWTLLDSTNNIIMSPKTKYIQVKALLESDSSMEYTPSLNKVEIVYHEGRSPQAPTNLKAIVANNSIVLNWEGSHENVTGYKIYYGTKSGIYNDYNPIIVNGNQTEYVINNLEYGKLYYFRVTTIGGEGGDIESEFSSEVYARPFH